MFGLAATWFTWKVARFLSGIKYVLMSKARSHLSPNQIGMFERLLKMNSQYLKASQQYYSRDINGQKLKSGNGVASSQHKMTKGSNATKCEVPSTLAGLYLGRLWNLLREEASPCNMQHAKYIKPWDFIYIYMLLQGPATLHTSFRRCLMVGVFWFKAATEERKATKISSFVCWSVMRIEMSRFGIWSNILWCRFAPYGLRDIFLFIILNAASFIKNIREMLLPKEGCDQFRQMGKSMFQVQILWSDCLTFNIWFKISYGITGTRLELVQITAVPYMENLKGTPNTYLLLQY